MGHIERPPSYCFDEVMRGGRGDKREHLKASRCSTTGPHSELEVH